jgi:hypothetical protein
LNEEAAFSILRTAVLQADFRLIDNKISDSHKKRKYTLGKHFAEKNRYYFGHIE